MVALKEVMWMNYFGVNFLNGWARNRRKSRLITFYLNLDEKGKSEIQAVIPDQNGY